MSTMASNRICVFFGFLTLMGVVPLEFPGAAANQVGKAKTNTEVPKAPPIKGIMDGKFVKPPQSTTPTSYFYAVSSEGDPIGAGKVLSYRGNTVRVVTVRDGVEAYINRRDWVLTLAAPKNGNLKVGEYQDAKRYPFNGNAPGLSFFGMGRGCNKLSGKFVVWELEVKGNLVTRLAADFVQQCEEKSPPLYGIVRFNSSFQ
jgi:hypothetical protein